MKHANLLVISLTLCACSNSEATPSAKTPNDNSAKQEVSERFDEASDVLSAFGKSVPKEQLARARCVVVMPSLKKGGLIVGARHGHGFATCRAPNGWSAPAPITISGGSAGFQIGYESSDVLMLIVTDGGMQRLMQGKVTLGADMSATAGPVGTGRAVGTDPSLKAEALSYSRSRGLFAGVELNGAALEQDEEATAALYGTHVDFRHLLSGDQPSPSEAQRFMTTVAETFASNAPP